MELATNTGKFVDRSPIICPAGKLFGNEETVQECLKYYSLQDQVDALKHQAGIYEEQPNLSYKLPPLRSHRHVGIFTECRATLCPPSQTRFQTLINDLKETSYDTYWNKSLGKCRDSGSGLPPHIDPVTTTFGIPSKSEISVKELVNPPKGACEVLWESQVGHEMYKKTHNDYNPSEQVERNYLTPPFDANKSFGMRTVYDPRGIWVKGCCHWHETHPVVTANIIQADREARFRPRLGQCLTPNDNIQCVPEGHVFGKLCKRDLYGAEDLMRDDCPPSLFKRDFHEWFDCINHLRNVLKRRSNSYFDLKYFQQKAASCDESNSGWIPKEFMYELCGSNAVHFEKEALEPLFLFLGILRQGHIHYPSFINLIDINKEMPEMLKVQDIPKTNLHYMTTYQAAQYDYLRIDHTGKRTAGVPSHRFDIPHVTVPPGQCSADKDSLGAETTCVGVLNPSIFTNYGLSHRDFFMPRSKEVIRRLFEKIGYNTSDEDFEKLWKKGLELDKTVGTVCIDTFYTLVKEVIPETVPPVAPDHAC